MAHHDHGMTAEDIAEHYGWDEGPLLALIAFGEAHRACVGDAARRSEWPPEASGPARRPCRAEMPERCAAA